jgi:hypothetical protein
VHREATHEETINDNDRFLVAGYSLSVGKAHFASDRRTNKSANLDVAIGGAAIKLTPVNSEQIGRVRLKTSGEDRYLLRCRRVDNSMTLTKETHNPYDGIGRWVEPRRS